MHSLSSARQLLTTLTTHHKRDELLAALGFATPALPLDPYARERLALPSAVTTASVARGTGRLRALVITLESNALPKDSITQIAQRLTTRVPHLFWLLITTQHDTSLLAIAAWHPITPHPHVAALVTYQDRITDSDAETLCALAAINTTTTPTAQDALHHARWLDILGRETITKRFYHALEQAVDTLAQSLTPTPRPSDARTLALLCTSRLLFLSFLETKGWLNNDFGFLINGFADTLARGKSYHQRVLDPLFFGTLNTRPTKRAGYAHAFGKIPFLNGGLFTRTPLERRLRHTTFTNDALSTLYEHVLGKYRFTAREDTTTWSEAAIDPEMLGKAFESLMAPKERHHSGAYFTPHALVEQITTATLAEALSDATIPKDVVTNALTHHPVPTELRGPLLHRTTTLRILDPACGSGAFLVHTLESLATLRAHLGDITPIAAIRRTILTRSIYGVDINPTAVWLCELRLWLSVVIESPERDPLRVLPLPNLDHQIRIGDSLAGGTFTHPIDPRTARHITTLRQRYARANGPRKHILAKCLDRAERARALDQVNHTITKTKHERTTLVRAARTRDLFAQRTGTTHASTRRLKELRATLHRLQTKRRAITDGAALPFAFATHYADVAAHHGFNVVLGNPPWVRIHHIAPAMREELRNTFHTFRNAPWHTGAKNTRASTGFASQTDLSALFIERAVDLLTPNGALGLLVPAKLWRSLAGGGTRALLQHKTAITALDDLTEAPAHFEAAVYPSIIVARRTTSQDAPSLCTTTIHRNTTAIRWTAPFDTLPLDHTHGAPWITIPPEVRNAFNTITRHSTPLAHTPLGRPTLGVKCGCNAAFLVNETGGTNTLATVTTTKHPTQIERALLRPLIRGETIQSWSITPSSEHIIWTHDRNTGAPLQTLPQHTLTWLNHWRSRLQHRSDARHQHRWWALFRTNAANTNTPRVVWGDLGQSPRATLLLPHDPAVPLNSCYVIHPPTIDDAVALTTLINTPLIAAWLRTIAEPARGGYRRFLGWTMALLPIPNDWQHARTILTPLGHRALTGHPPTPEELHNATLHAYNISATTITPLLEWNTP